MDFLSYSPQTSKTMTFFLILFCSGLFISTIAAWVSIIGLSSIFPGAIFTVTLMGIALEIGKLTSVSWLYRFWNKTNFILKIYFTCAILILSIINSIGVFGYLSKAHIEGTQGIEAGSDQIGLLDAQIEIEKQTIQSNRSALQQMDGVVNKLTASERTTERAVQVRSSQRRERSTLNTEIVVSNKKIVELQQQKSLLSVAQRKLETDVGPIKYVAQFVYGKKDTDTIEHAITILILILILVFDPLAILLLVAANMQLSEIRKKPVVPIVDPEKTKDPTVIKFSEISESPRVIEFPEISQHTEKSVVNKSKQQTTSDEPEFFNFNENYDPNSKIHDIVVKRRLLNHIKKLKFSK